MYLNKFDLIEFQTKRIHIIIRNTYNIFEFLIKRRHIIICNTYNIFEFLIKRRHIIICNTYKIRISWVTISYHHMNRIRIQSQTKRHYIFASHANHNIILIESKTQVALIPLLGFISDFAAEFFFFLIKP